MSKVIYCILKNREKKGYLEKVKEIATIIPPDNITPNPSVFFENKGVIGCIVNPVNSIRVKEQSICLGAMMPEPIDWHIPESEIPNGCFALFRSNKRFVEIASDFLATRTIWYVKTTEMFIASSSQRAIIMLLGSFHLDNNAVAWMLSSGTLGPGFSWDTKLKCLKPDAKILLDREKWDVKISEGKVEFSTKEDDLISLKMRYTEVMRNDIKNMNIDTSKCFLPLTGGKDSRLMLSILNDVGKNPYCVTWGLKGSLNMEGSDADIASRLSEYLKLKWKYYYTDFEGQDAPKQVLSRYIKCSEGSLDNIEHFSDGLAVWKRLFENGFEVGIGGSHGFGHKKWVNNDFHIRARKKLSVLRDFYNIPENISEHYNQHIESYLNKEEWESYIQYSIRIHQQFFTPFADAALNETKCNYVEMIDPMESRNIIRLMRTIPDKYSKEKILTSEIAKLVAPEIGFNTKLSVKKTISTLKNPLFNNEIKNVLSGHYKNKIFPEKFLVFLTSNMSQNETEDGQLSSKKRSVYNYLVSLAPLGLKNKYKEIFIKKMNIDINLLAFRVYIIIKMHELLSHDAKYFNTKQDSKTEQISA